MNTRARRSHTTNSQSSLSSQQQREMSSPFTNQSSSTNSSVPRLSAFESSTSSSSANNSTVVQPVDWYSSTLPPWTNLPSSTVAQAPQPNQLSPAALEWYSNAARYAASVQYWQFVSWSQWAYFAAAMNGGGANAGLNLSHFICFILWFSAGIAYLIFCL